MTTPADADQPQPRDIALEQVSPDQAAELEAQSDGHTGAADRDQDVSTGEG